MCRDDSPDGFRLRTCTEEETLVYLGCTSRDSCCSFDKLSFGCSNNCIDCIPANFQDGEWASGSFLELELETVCLAMLGHSHEMIGVVGTFELAGILLCDSNAESCRLQAVDSNSH